MENPDYIPNPHPTTGLVMTTAQPTTPPLPATEQLAQLFLQDYWMVSWILFFAFWAIAIQNVLGILVLIAKITE